jgi:hypothetical protein
MAARMALNCIFAESFVCVFTERLEVVSTQEVQKACSVV